MHAPIGMDEALVEEIRGLGEVAWIVAPNLFHHLYVVQALEAFPSAQLYGAPGFAAKRKDLSFDGFLDEEREFPWSQELAQLPIEGAPKLNEYVFFHHATGTLIVTDLVFNMHDCPYLWSRLVFRMVGAYGKVAQSRLWRWMTRDKHKKRASVEKVLAWESKRLVMAHGQIVESDVPSQLRRGLGWLW